MIKRFLFIAVMALVWVACGGGESGDDGVTTTGSSETTTTAATEDPPDTTTSTAAPAAGGSIGSIVVDGVTLEFTDVYECQIGQDGGSPDYREFGGRTADGSADLSIAYFPPDDAFASLTGATMEREVDGENWTYASSYAGSDGQFTIELANNGATGTAEMGVIGIGNPYGGDTLITEWTFTCG